MSTSINSLAMSIASDMRACPDSIYRFSRVRRALLVHRRHHPGPVRMTTTVIAMRVARSLLLMLCAAVVWQPAAFGPTAAWAQAPQQQPGPADQAVPNSTATSTGEHLPPGPTQPTPRPPPPTVAASYCKPPATFYAGSGNSGCLTAPACPGGTYAAFVTGTAISCCPAGGYAGHGGCGAPGAPILPVVQVNCPTGSTPTMAGPPIPGSDQVNGTYCLTPAGCPPGYIKSGNHCARLDLSLHPLPARNTNQIQTPTDKYHLPPQGPQAPLSTSPAPPVTNVTAPAPGPTCAPPASPSLVWGPVFPGQTQYAIAVCQTAGPACPPGTNLAGASNPPNSAFSCCPSGTSLTGFGSHQCCPLATSGPGVVCGGPPVPAIEINCAAGSVSITAGQCLAPATCASGYTLTGRSCCPNDMVSSLGSCCPPGQPPRAGGGCTLPPAAQSANQIPPTIEQYKIPPQGPGGAPVGTGANVATTVVPPTSNPSPICAPPATLSAANSAPLAIALGQTQQPLAVCSAPASGCPLETEAFSAVRVSLTPGSTYYCCPNGTQLEPFSTQCCPPGGARACKQPVPALAVNCPAGSVEMGLHKPFCVTAASCLRGYTLTGASCCPNDMVSSLGSCCPPGQPPRAGGGCTLPPAAQSANQIPPPIEQYTIPPQVPQARPPTSTSTSVANVAPSPCPPGKVLRDKVCECPAGFAQIGATCCPRDLVTKDGTCAPPPPPTVPSGQGVLPNLQTSSPTTPPIEQYVIPPGGPGAPVPPSTSVPVTNVQTPATGPLCGPSATLSQLLPSGWGFPSQLPNTWIDVCSAPVPGCPAGTFAAGTTFPPTATYYCCPNGTQWTLTGPSCCPNNTACSPSTNVPAVAMNCLGGAIAFFPGNPSCVTPATCPPGYALTGTRCCPNDFVTLDHLCKEPPPRPPGPNPPPPNPPAPVVNLNECPSGLVRRDAFRGDPVCVTRATRAQIIAENTAAPAHTRPNGNCRPGFMWREAGEGDHVCVAPASRSQAATDNRNQCGGDLHCRNGVTNRLATTNPVATPPKSPKRIVERHWPINSGTRRPPLPRPPAHDTRLRSTAGHPLTFGSTMRRNDRRR